MEGEEITLRQMIREHMNESSKANTAMLIELSSIKTHGEYTKKTLEDHTKRVGVLEISHNKQKGAMWAVGFGGLTGIIHAIKSWLGS